MEVSVQVKLENLENVQVPKLEEVKVKVENAQVPLVPAAQQPKTEEKKKPKSATKRRFEETKVKSEAPAPKRRRVAAKSKPKPKAKKNQRPFTYWGPEQQGKDPARDYIPPAADLRVNPAFEQGYQFMLRHKRLTPKKYDLIQCARCHWDKYGEVPPGLNDLLY
jgi:hypothetical protein